ncbi:MAG: hypothetical protein HFJ12_01160 [Bacilli bacterium]|nr:hypothetical protein [Bacilli bacterium]
MDDLVGILNSDPYLKQRISHQEFLSGKSGFDDNTLDTVYQEYQRFKNEESQKDMELTKLLADDPTLTEKITHEDLSDGSIRAVYQKKRNK